MSASLRRLCQASLQWQYCCKCQLWSNCVTSGFEQVLRQPTSRALSATEATCGLILRTSLLSLCSLMRYIVFRSLHSKGYFLLLSAADVSKPDSLLHGVRFASLYDDTDHVSRLWLTSGEKFGAAFLTYCADPMVVHSQYCVHVVDASKELDAVVLAGIARGSHGARKHLLLAAVELVRILGSYTSSGAVNMCAGTLRHCDCCHRMAWERCRWMKLHGSQD